MLPVASSAEIIRAALKDEEYIAELSSSVSALAADLLPNALFSSPRTAPTIGALSRGIYTLLAMRGVSRRRTPGEEYASVLPISISRPARASMAVVVVLAFLKAAGRHASFSLLHEVWNLLYRRRFVSTRFPATAANNALEFAERAHLAIFYLFGVYYNVSHRLLRLRYVRTAAPSPDSAVGNRYQILGVLLAIQLISSAFGAVRRSYARAIQRFSSAANDSSAKYYALLGKEVLFSLLFARHYEAEESDSSDSCDEHEVEPSETASVSGRSDPFRPQSDVPVSSTDGPKGQVSSSGQISSRSSRRKCPLCLSHLNTPTLTTCGHVFCWRCIGNWCATNQVCPLCRRPVSMHRDLVCLYNY